MDGSDDACDDDPRRGKGVKHAHAPRATRAIRGRVHEGRSTSTWIVVHTLCTSRGQAATGPQGLHAHGAR